MSSFNGGPQQTARARVYRLAQEGIQKIADVAMYKAVLELATGGEGRRLVIRPDYGKEGPIELPFADPDSVRRLLALTRGEGLFVLEPLGFDPTELSPLH